MDMTLEIQSLEPNHSSYGSISNEEPHKPQAPPSAPSVPVLYVSKPTPTIRKSLKIILASSWINCLLIFVPFGYLAHIFEWDDSWIFILNFLAILPLSKLYDFATVDVSLRVGQSIGCLLNATFGNAVELIIAIIALTKGEIRVVQASLLGAIISNLLFIMGICFVAGGTFYSHQKFSLANAQTISSLMTIACIGLIIPASFNFAINGGDTNETTKALVDLSHGTAMVLLMIYVLYLYFQLKTHSHLYHEEEEEEEEAQLSLSVLLFLFVIVTVIVAFSAEYLVDSIEGLVASLGLSKTFVGLILLPIIGNAAEFSTAINAALNNKMNFAIKIAAGSSMQIALLLTPLLVLFGWIIGQNFTLDFHPFETVVMFISVLITNYLILDGKSNWLEGVMLLGTYAIVSLAFFFYPN